jgi:hypothetical protein
MSRSDRTPTSRLSGIEHYKHTDTVRGEQFCRLRQIGCRFDGDDITALGGKNGFQTHIGGDYPGKESSWQTPAASRRLGLSRTC